MHQIRTAPINAASVAASRWQERLIRSGYFVGAVLLHLIVFFMLATFIIFRAPVQPTDSATFSTTTVKPPPPPPAPPAAAGGDTLNNLEPAVETVPTPTAPSIVVSSNPTNFSVDAVKVTIPNLPSSMSAPAGTGLAGHNAPGEGSGTGSPFGSAEDGGSSLLEGFLYDLKQTPDRTSTGMDPGGYHNKIRQFVAANWDPSLLHDYYKCRKPLSTSSIFVPIINATDGPKAFGVADEVKPDMYCVWYKVTAAPTQEGTYHFVGIGDDILVVRVNGNTVLDGCNIAVTDDLRKKQKTINMTNFDPTYGPNGDFQVGTPFHVSAGESVDIDVLIGEEPGGKSDYFLFIQREESTYETQSNGTPLLPIFQLDPKPIQPTGVPRSFPPFSATPEPWEPVAK